MRRLVLPGRRARYLCVAFMYDRRRSTLSSLKWGRLPFWVVLCALTACGGSSPAGPSDSGGLSGDELRITGSEQIGWNQFATASPEALGYRFSMYIDGALAELPNARCTSTTTAGQFSCTSPLPPLNPGRHTLELVTWWGDPANRSESPRAAPLVVVVGTAGTAPAATAGH